jgi:hypothetical protein
MFIFKSHDDYFFIKLDLYDEDRCYYKCDQLSGLKKCLNNAI